MQVFIYCYEEDVAGIFFIYFNKLCNRFKFVTSFWSLTLLAANRLLWKKILIVRDEEIKLSHQERELGGLPAYPKVLTFPFCWILPPPKNLVLPPFSSIQTTYWEEKVSLIVFRQFLPNILPVACIFSYIIMIYLKKLDRTKTLNTKQCPAGLSPRIIPHITPFLPKWPLLWCCFVGPTLCGLSPFLWTFMENLGDGGKSYTTAKHLLISLIRKSSLHRFTSFVIKSDIPSPSNSSFHVTALSKLHL